MTRSSSKAGRSRGQRRGVIAMCMAEVSRHEHIGQGQVGQARTTIQKSRSEDCTEVHVAATPTRCTGHRCSVTKQAREVYGALEEILNDLGAGPEHVVSETIHFRDIENHLSIVQLARREFFGADGDRSVVPACSFLEQPPCDSSIDISLQAWIVVPDQDSDTRIWTPASRDSYASINIIENPDSRWIRVSNCIGLSSSEGQSVPFMEQAREMFERAASSLKLSDASFQDVVRTWIYVKDIDRDYAGLNTVRDSFFKNQGVIRLPASTGIQGGPFPTRAQCSVDLLAYQGPPTTSIRTMHADSLNEAPDYGPRFSRGMCISTKDRKLMLISGTASIDSQGNVVHLGDPVKQTHRMFQNIRGLLETQGATMSDLVSLTSYLKDRSFYLDFVRICREEGVPATTPNTIVEAGVCRPTWLVEVEGIASLAIS